MLEGLPVTPDITVAVKRFRYNTKVFILPPWQDIYGTDAERKQSFPVAEATYRAMAAAYTLCGYNLVTVPTGKVTERTVFILGKAEAQ